MNHRLSLAAAGALISAALFATAHSTAYAGEGQSKLPGAVGDIVQGVLQDKAQEIGRKGKVDPPIGLQQGLHMEMTGQSSSSLGLDGTRQLWPEDVKAMVQGTAVSSPEVLSYRDEGRIYPLRIGEALHIRHGYGPMSEYGWASSTARTTCDLIYAFYAQLGRQASTPTTDILPEDVVTDCAYDERSLNGALVTNYRIASNNPDNPMIRYPAGERGINTLFPDVELFRPIVRQRAQAIAQAKQLFFATTSEGMVYDDASQELTVRFRFYPISGASKAPQRPGQPDRTSVGSITGPQFHSDLNDLDRRFAPLPVRMKDFYSITLTGISPERYRQINSSKYAYKLLVFFSPIAATQSQLRATGPHFYNNHMDVRINKIMLMHFSGSEAITYRKISDFPFSFMSFPIPQK